MPRKSSRPDASPSVEIAGFESALEELERLVETLEGGETSLDDSLKHFERGVALARACRRTLETAEQRVRILMEDDPQGDLLDLEPGQRPDALTP